jgi:hypothetical protein
VGGAFSYLTNHLLTFSQILCQIEMQPGVNYGMLYEARSDSKSK